jgi:hypothetical protein
VTAKLPMGLFQLWRCSTFSYRYSHLKSSVAIGSFGSGAWLDRFSRCFSGKLPNWDRQIREWRKAQKVGAHFHGAAWMDRRPKCLFSQSNPAPVLRAGSALRGRSIKPRSAVASPCAFDALLWSVLGSLYSFGRRWFRWGMLLRQDELCIQLSQLTVDGGSLLR